MSGDERPCEAPGCQSLATHICSGTDAGMPFVARVCESHAIYLGEDEDDETFACAPIAPNEDPEERFRGVRITDNTGCDV